MLDRLISGAGAVADAADRAVRALARGGGGSAFGRQPGSLLMAGGLAVLAIALVVVGLESSIDPTPRRLAPADIATANLADRTVVDMAGHVATQYVETFDDLDGDGKQGPGEVGQAWYYFMIDPASRTGVTVRSQTPPSRVYAATVTGRVVEDPTYIADDARFFADELAQNGVTLDPTKYLDTRASAEASPGSLDALPASGSTVAISGIRSLGYSSVCASAPDGDGACSTDAIDGYEYFVYDPDKHAAVTVVSAESPEFVPATFQGILRRDVRAVSEAQDVEGLAFADLDLSVSPTFVLDAGARPPDPMLAFGLAAGLSLVVGLIVVGLAGGYLRFRPAGPLPAAADVLAVGMRIPVRVSGDLRTPRGLLHVREAVADLVRFGLSDAPNAPSTLIVERRDRPEGVAVGAGELTDLMAGTVSPFRGPRPALRATAGTGRLLLSFDAVEERDRAAAALLHEAGLGHGATTEEVGS
jgi:hypothetical protein